MRREQGGDAERAGIRAGMAVIPEADKADVVIVNTCSFIDSSKEESIGHVLEVQESEYSQRFGGASVARSDVVDANVTCR